MFHSRVIVSIGMREVQLVDAMTRMPSAGRWSAAVFSTEPSTFRYYRDDHRHQANYPRSMRRKTPRPKTIDPTSHRPIR